jgi:molybdopterin molybdotransferase
MTVKNATPDVARQVMVRALAPLGSMEVRLDQAKGRVLAQDIVAMRDQPPFAASAMDGYCVRSGDGAGPLCLIGQSAAGAGFAGQIEAGQCVRIFTGAPVPTGGDAVVIQEDVTVEGTTITVPATSVGRHIRPQGVDFKTGTKLLSVGEKLDPIGLALVAATGRDQVCVARAPVVAIMSGGDEIVSPGQVSGPFDVYDSISTGMAALVRASGGEAVLLAPKRDTIEALYAGFVEAFAGADLIVTIGGASVGDRDLMKPALATFEPQFLVDNIAVRPGKPTWFATTREGTVLGLPGNPASALVCGYLFLVPILAALMGRTYVVSLSHAKLTTDLPANGPREHYLRAKTHLDASGQMQITPCELQDSSLLSVFHAANALIRLPAGQEAMQAGDVVSFLDLARGA